MMPNTEERVADRLARLEEKIDALDQRLDTLSEEMRRATTWIRTEHAADREAFRLATKNLRRF